MGVSSPPKMWEAGRTCLCPTLTMFRCSVSVRNCSPLGVILNTCHEDKEQAVLPNQLPGLAGAEAMLGDAGMGDTPRAAKGSAVPADLWPGRSWSSNAEIQMI